MNMTNNQGNDNQPLQDQGRSIFNNGNQWSLQNGFGNENNQGNNNQQSQDQGLSILNDGDKWSNQNGFANQNGGGGRGLNLNNCPVCQLCEKQGHTALICHYRFDQNYGQVPNGGENQN